MTNVLKIDTPKLKMIKSITLTIAKVTVQNGYDRIDAGGVVWSWFKMHTIKEMQGEWWGMAWNCGEWGGFFRPVGHVGKDPSRGHRHD